MSAKTPGSCHSVQLVPPPSTRNLSLCLICQHVKDSNGSSSLSSTEAGRQVIIDTSRKLNDDLLHGIESEDLKRIQYHCKGCYGPYRLKGQRYKPEPTKRKSESEDISKDSFLVSPSTNRQKRSKPSKSPDVKEKPCVICDHVKCHGVSERSRVETYDVAERLLKAVTFNKDPVYTRLVLLKDIGDVFAADVMYHKKCMNKYLKQFQRDVDRLMQTDFDNSGNEDVVTALSYL